MDPNTRNYWQPEESQTPAPPSPSVQPPTPQQPGVQAPAPPQPAQEAPAPVSEPPQPEVPVVPVLVSPPQPVAEPAPLPAAPPQNKPTEPVAPAETTPPQETPTSNDVNGEQPWQLPQQEEPADDASHASDTVEWRASEYIHHDKSMAWYAVLGVITAVGTAVAAFFQQWLFAVLIVVMGVALGFFARRPPREVPYRIAADGVTIAERTFPFTQFKSFGVIDEGAFYSVQLRPAKRFMPGISIYFARDDGERIFDALAAHLPMEEMKLDPVDKFMRWLRF